MYPIILRISGNINIYTYGLFYALGFVGGLAVTFWLTKREAREPEDAPFAAWGFNDLVSLAVWMFLGMVGGARLFFILQNNPIDFLSHPHRIIAVYEGGFVFYGGMILGLLALYIFSHIRKVSFLRLLDLLAPGVAIGHVLGRIGCLMAGCCYGKLCDLPWAVTFTHPSSLAPKGIPLHPVQLYEALGEAAIFCVLITLFLRHYFRGRGQLALTYLMLYSVLRFGVEFYRGDVQRGYVTLWGMIPEELLSTSQFISAIIFVLSLVIWIYLRAKSSQER